MSNYFARPVVSIIVERGLLRRRILLQRRNKSDPGIPRSLFELPQGRVKWGESLTECVRRELQEETGMTGFLFRSHVRQTYVRGARLESITGLVVSEAGERPYLAVCVVGTADGEPRASRESSQPTWFSKRGAMKLIQSGQVFPLNVPMLVAYFGNSRDRGR